MEEAASSAEETFNRLKEKLNEKDALIDKLKGRLDQKDEQIQKLESDLEKAQSQKWREMDDSDFTTEILAKIKTLF